MQNKLTRTQSPFEQCLEIPGICGKLLDFLLVNDRVRIQSLNKSLRNLDCAPAHLANELHLRDHHWQDMADICSRFKRITVLEIWANKLHQAEPDHQFFNTSELFSEDCLGVKLYSWAQKIQKIWILGTNGLMNHMYGNNPICEDFNQTMREPEEIHQKIPRKSWNKSEGLESFLNTSHIEFDSCAFDEFTHLFPNIIFLDIRCQNSEDSPDFGLMERLTKMKYLIVSGSYDCHLKLENFKNIPLEQLEHLHLRKCMFLQWKDISLEILRRGKNLNYYQGKANDMFILPTNNYKMVTKIFKATYGHDIIICAEWE